MNFLGLDIKFHGFDIWHKGNFDPAVKADKSYVDSIQIGGRNLVEQSTLQYTALLASANFVWTWVNNISSMQCTNDGLHYTATATNGAPNSSYGMKINSADFGLKVGDTIAFSSDIKGTFGTSNNGLCVMHANTSNANFWGTVSAGISYPTSISDWTRKGRTYTIPSNIKIETDGSFYLYLFWGGGTGSAVDVYVRDVKVEKGNKPTDWTPAPEDVQAQIDKKSNIGHTHTKSQITDMPTKLSQFTNDMGFTTQSQSGLIQIISNSQPSGHSSGRVWIQTE